MISAENTNYNLRFSDIADKDIEQAIEYHSRKSESGEYNFKAQLNIISKEQEKIIILAVLPAKADPQKWKYL